MATSQSIAKPYARALFELCADKIQRGVWLHRLQILDKIFQDPTILRAVEAMSPNQAVAWLRDVVGDALDPEAFALMTLLIQNRRLGSLGDIRTRFAYLMVEFHQFGVLHVTSAVPLGDLEKSQTHQAFEKVFGRKLIPHFHVDPVIRGGLVGQVDDLVYDGSVKGSLEKLRENLI